jgi:hypothetical protein
VSQENVDEEDADEEACTVGGREEVLEAAGLGA